MLPVESLTEAVSYLPLYDLDSVLLANRLLSSIASKRVRDIGLWEFDYVNLFIRENWMALSVPDDALIYSRRRENMADILGIALHNARFGRFALTVYPGGVLPLPNNSALEVEELALRVNGVPSADLIIDVIARFRKVHVIHLFECENLTDFSPVINLCRQKRIRSVINKSNDVDLMAER